MARTERSVELCMAAIRVAISCVALPVCPASAFTSWATTLEPATGLAGADASMVRSARQEIGLRGNRMMRSVTLPISRATLANSSIVVLVTSASPTAALASCDDWAAFAPTSEIVCANPSPASAADRPWSRSIRHGCRRHRLGAGARRCRAELLGARLQRGRRGVQHLHALRHLALEAAEQVAHPIGAQRGGRQVALALDRDAFELGRGRRRFAVGAPRRLERRADGVANSDDGLGRISTTTMTACTATRAKLLPPW